MLQKHLKSSFLQVFLKNFPAGRRGTTKGVPPLGSPGGDDVMTIMLYCIRKNNMHSIAYLLFDVCSISTKLFLDEKKLFSKNNKKILTIFEQSLSCIKNIDFF